MQGIIYIFWVSYSEFSCCAVVEVAATTNYTQSQYQRSLKRYYRIYTALATKDMEIFQIPSQ
jgi:hypothetical protein